MLLLIMLIMNAQNKLSTVQFSHCPTTNSQPVPKQRSQNPELTGFKNFAEQTEIPKKFELLEKRGFKLTEKEKRFLPLSQPSFIC